MFTTISNTPTSFAKIVSSLFKRERKINKIYVSQFNNETTEYATTHSHPFSTNSLREPLSEHSVKDLTRYGIEPNPGPSFMDLPSTKGMINPNRFKGYVPYVSGWDYIDDYETKPFVLQSGSNTIALSDETDYIVKLMENVFTFLRLLSKAKDREDQLLAIAVFAQCRSDRSLTSTLIERWNDIMSLSLQDGDTQNTFSKLRDILSQYETVKKLPIFTKLYKFLCYCVGTSMFENMGVKFDTKRFFNVEEALLKKEYHMGPDFVHCMLDTVLFISETGYQCMVTGSVSPIFHHESTYDAWIQEGETLRLQAKYITNPEPHGFTVFDFLNRLENTIEKGKAMVKFMNKDSCASIVRRLLADLEGIKADTQTKRLAQQERKAPFAVLVHGNSGVCKTQFTKLLFYHYGKLFNLPISDEYKFTRNAFDPYWTNFNTSQWCLQLDDIAYLHPNKSSECDPTLVEMLQVVNNVPFVPTQADLCDKGKTPVRARFVIATTNTENLNAETYFACPLAVQRRLPYIFNIEPKTDYKLDNGPMMDTAKIPPSVEGEYPDLWRITVKQVMPAIEKTTKSLHMGQTADYKTIGIYEDIYSFLEWFNPIAKHAEGIQTKALKCDSDMRQVKLCEHGFPFSKCSICGNQMSLQAGEIIPYIHTEWNNEFWRRHSDFEAPDDYTPPSDYDLPPGQMHTTQCILECISQMGIYDKCVVFFYYSVFWFMDRFPFSGPAIVAFFLGRWYFWIIACRLMHLPLMRKLCFRLLGAKMYRSIRSPKVVRFCASIVSAVALIKAGQLLLNLYGYMNAKPTPPDEHFYKCSGCDECNHIPNEERELKSHRFTCKGYGCINCPLPKMYMCFTKKCKICTVCIERNKLYASGADLPYWPGDTLDCVKENHAIMCDGSCKRCMHLQGAAAERGSVPESKNDKKENVWYKDSFECTPFDVTPSNLSKNNWSMDDLVKHVSANCVSYIIRARTEDTVCEKYGKATCIGGHTYLFNNHCVPYDHFELSLVFQSGKDGVTTNFTTLVTPSQLKRIPGKDLLFVQLPSIPPKRDIRDLFAKSSFEGRFDGEYIARCIDGSMTRNTVVAPKLDREFHYIDPSVGVEIETPAWSAKVSRETLSGDCGSLLTVKTAMGPMILGIHVLGGGCNECVSLSVDYDLLMSLDSEIFSDSKPNLQVGDYKQEVVELSKKATVRYIEEGTMIVYGSLAGFRGKLKSRVTPTYMSDVAVRDGYEKKTGAPVMNSWVPWRRALLDMTRPVTHIDLTLLSHCVDNFTADILKGLSQTDLGELKVYSLNVAVNGCPGVAYVDKMPRNTSAGFPFRKSKKFFLEAVPAFDEYSHPVKVTSEIEQEMDYIIVQYENSRVYCPVFTASLKDEPTLHQKILDGKTRVFCGAPLPWSLVVRMYLLSTIRLIQKNRFLFEAGPGTIAQSREWDDIYHYITQFGEDRVVAGDYGKFDKRMPASVILAAFEIIKNILKAAGWSDRDLKVVSGIAEDTAFPTIDFHGELIRCYGTNPSGHPLTVIINGLANSLYVRYCYASNHPQKTCDGFKDNISLFTYGDDMIMGVNPQCTWLNHTIMQETLASIDIEFTMADKHAKSVPFIHIDQATFLRRSWRYEEQLDCMVCPIEHASIEKMLTMCVESKTISKQLQAVAVLDTACREYFWYGEEIFHQKRALFYKWIEELDLFMYLERELPTWEQLKNEFLVNSSLR